MVAAMVAVSLARSGPDLTLWSTFDYEGIETGKNSLYAEDCPEAAMASAAPELLAAPRFVLAAVREEMIRLSTSNDI